MSDALYDQMLGDGGALFRQPPDVPSQSSRLERMHEASAPVQFERGATLFSERERSDHVAILASGLCVAIKRTRDGQQQNVAIYVPGDVLGHEVFTLGAATSTIIAMTPVTCRRISVSRLRDAMERDPDLATDFWRYVAYQGALAQEWMVGLGRRPALERTAHLLCELIFRMRAAGQGTEASCPFPLTQTDLSDILGLSVVHVNRTLQKLRQTGYVALQRGRLEILDWARLTTLGGFETFYLDRVAEA